MNLGTLQKPASQRTEWQTGLRVVIPISIHFRLGRQHLIQYVFVVCLLRRNLWENQVGVPFGSTGVDTQGPLRALILRRWVLRKSRGLGPHFFNLWY